MNSLVLLGLWFILCQDISFAIRRAVCVVQPDPGSQQKVTGTVTFTQLNPRSPITIAIKLQGFKEFDPSTAPSQLLHGFHVHEFGDLTAGCTSAGGHYNPCGVNHGAKEDNVRHNGDLGNIQQEPNGTIPELVLTDRFVTLYGDWSVLGRAIVVHEKADDLGRGGDQASLTNGNAGSRLGCCVIGLAKTN
ncbi:unnamed protein product [Lymnaea stagnalis]|uniref:Superoxide dismutase [Cu-Zn] n=1 Tax=Lymnaea stagnalis TaxID=6523 RepID=A0AAV2H5F0_LYMST